MKIRLIGTQDEITVAIHRLRNAFDEIDTGKPVPSNADPGKWRVYVKVVRF